MADNEPDAVNRPSTEQGSTEQGDSDQSDRLPPDEETKLLDESSQLRIAANGLFGEARYDEALQGYETALASCPSYRHYETAALQCNIALAHLKLADWKAAVDSSTQALAVLDKLSPPLAGLGNEEEAAGAAEEVDDDAAEKITRLHESGRTLAEVERLRVKALQRRAKARLSVGTWAALQAAEADYKQLSKSSGMSKADRRMVDDALRSLPSTLDSAKQAEVSEMMSKLKDLGNGILKPFGLSTNNFQFTKDDASGGYSMQFDQNADKKR